MYTVYSIDRLHRKMAAVSPLTGKGFRLDVKHSFRVRIQAAEMQAKINPLIPEEFLE